MGYTSMRSLLALQTRNRLKTGWHFKVSFWLCVHFWWTGTVLQYSDVSGLALCTSKNAHSELGHCLDSFVRCQSFSVCLSLTTLLTDSRLFCSVGNIPPRTEYFRRITQVLLWSNSIIWRLWWMGSSAVYSRPPSPNQQLFTRMLI